MADRNTPWKDGVLITCSVAAQSVIEAGKMVAINGSGYAVPASDTSGLKVVGVADERVDNSGGAAGDRLVRVLTGKLFELENDSTNAVSIAHVGKLVYVKDAATVTSSQGTNGVPAGYCAGLGDNGVWVRISAVVTQIATQAASTATDAAGVVTDLNALITKLVAAGLMAKA